MSLPALRRITTFALLLALTVMMLGAYTRLTNAGLGCPDWPRCYGHWVVQAPDALHPIESTKAWTEMAHRYAAGSLALFLTIITASIFQNRSFKPHRPLALWLVSLLGFQAALGMWTVTLKLLPVVVMGHLLGGMLILATLATLRCRLSALPTYDYPRWRLLITVVIAFVFFQIALGGWVSANYAGIACIGFPTCNGQWFAPLHWSGSFHLLSPLGPDYQGGVLLHSERMTIQVLHRLGALLVFTATLLLSIGLLVRVKPLRQQAGILLLIVSLQCTLGILNVVYLLPLSIAVLHNGVAGLLLTTLLFIRYQTRSDPSLHTLALRDYLELCKPRVVALMLLTVIVGMCLATPNALPWPIVLADLFGIALCAGSAAAINHVVDKRIDTLMRRTQKRPVAEGRISVQQAIFFAFGLGLTGLGILFYYVNPLTALLTFLTIMGYAGIYTGYLKRATPQNIVIGGLAGAAPPLLGWTAITNHLDPQALLLVLIIFTWTPAHFWALAIYRFEDYKQAKIPMLPVTHGIPYTKLNVLLYTLLLIAVSLLPFVVRMSGPLYLLGALLLGARFLYWAIRLYRGHEAQIALKTFRFSIIYLMLLFVFLLIDHYL